MLSPEIFGLIGIFVLVLVIFSGIPVAFALIIVGALGFGFLTSPEAALAMIARDIWEVSFGYTLTVVPVFILMGQISYGGQISQKLFATAHSWLGQFPGGIAITTIGACAAFGAVCGSVAAGTATMATLALPEMKKYGYAQSLATGSVVAGGTLSSLIPPSVVFIIYGIMTEQSIGKLFVAGILPGVLLALMFMVTIYIACRQNPALGPAGPKSTFGEKVSSLAGVLDMLILFTLVLGGLYLGWFSPTEAGAAGAFAAIVITTIRRSLTWRAFVRSFVETVQISCMVLFLVIGATVFGHFLMVSNIPLGAADLMSSLNLSPWAVLTVIAIIFLLGGCIMDGLAFMILTLPIFLPIIKIQGYDPLWFGVVITMLCNMGAITPPVGMGVYIVKGIAPEVPIETIFKGACIFLIPYIICLIVLTVFPQIALYLPNLIEL